MAIAELRGKRVKTGGKPGEKVACFTKHCLFSRIEGVALCRQSVSKSFVVMAEIRLDTLHPPQDIPETAHEGILREINVFPAVGQTLCIGAKKVVAVGAQLSVERPAGMLKTREHVLLDSLNPLCGSDPVVC